MTIDWKGFQFHVPQKLWDIAEKKAKEYGWTTEAVICDAAEKYLGYEEMVTVEIPKSLYDRVDIFGFVDKVIVSELKEWVEIMENEEKVPDKRFKVYYNLLGTLLSSYYEVINTYPYDRENAFVGIYSGISDKESLLRIASEGYGIEENEIEFNKECLQ